MFEELDWANAYMVDEWEDHTTVFVGFIRAYKFDNGYGALVEINCHPLAYRRQCIVQLMKVVEDDPLTFEPIGNKNLYVANDTYHGEYEHLRKASERLHEIKRIRC